MSTTESPQWSDALGRANTIRLARAAHKRTLRGQRSLAASWMACARLIEDPPAELEGIHVAELIGACRQCGPAKVASVLRATGVGDSFTVGSLTERQRVALSVLLRHGSMVDAPDVRGALGLRETEFQHREDVVRQGAAW